jgi:hypothetical protein
VKGVSTGIIFLVLVYKQSPKEKTGSAGITKTNTNDFGWHAITP